MFEYVFLLNNNLFSRRYMTVREECGKSHVTTTISHVTCKLGHVTCQLGHMTCHVTTVQLVT